ncbi:hypothetical protein GYMLUDRAFT_59725 [Collybiopsis luxurians FD-317 M1]|uniref:Uncharacterized protein n=1 Tax=Collybiopsis luxurians FD-317 M1 TaxID=944289 RepID=A0A0D0CMS8_9AGAR|nr:hypothetical protein GYMLUDRAFT_59725 [Collybiopsis luxurians FD-317 M1]
MEEEFPSSRTRMKKPKAYERGVVENKLQRVLEAERDHWFLEKWGPNAMLLPQAFWPDDVMDLIVDWAHNGKLNTTENFTKLITWAYAEELCSSLLAIIQANYCLPLAVPLSSPFTVTSIHPLLNSPGPSIVAPPKARKNAMGHCSRCQTEGHCSTWHVLL